MTLVEDFAHIMTRVVRNKESTPITTIHHLKISIDLYWCNPKVCTDWKEQLRWGMTSPNSCIGKTAKDSREKRLEE